MKDMVTMCHSQNCSDEQRTHLPCEFLFCSNKRSIMIKKSIISQLIMKHPLSRNFLTVFILALVRKFQFREYLLLNIVEFLLKNVIRYKWYTSTL